MPRKKTKSEAGRLGGQTTANRYGRPYMAALGRKGAEAFHARYRLVPTGTNDFLIVDRATGQPTGRTVNGKYIPPRKEPQSETAF